MTEMSTGSALWRAERPRHATIGPNPGGGSHDPHGIALRAPSGLTEGGA
jgi:hypothetical protein